MSYISGNYRRIYGDSTVSGEVLAAGTGAANVLSSPDTAHTIYVQRVVIGITTAAAQTITVQDTAGTPVPIAQVAASATGAQEFDFGDKGIALTAGKNLSLVNTAGPAYSYTVTAYIRQTGATQASTADRTV